MDRRIRKRDVVAILFGITFVVAAVFFLLKESERDPLESESGTSQSDLMTIIYDGKSYRYNPNLMNILFMGLDKDGELLDQDIPGDAGQADSIMLFSLDRETKQMTILQIPRDTMTEIDLYDGNGNRYGTADRHLALQYAYGSGGDVSCWAMKTTVSEMLYELPIDGHLALDISSVFIVNDAIGGVEVTFEKDYTEIDPSFVAGTTLTLTGEQAHRFVRYRDTEEAFSNQDRMERQLQYIHGLFNSMKKFATEQQDFYDILVPVVEKYMLTDLNETQITSFVDFDLKDAEVWYLPGEWVSGETYDEYHVDDKELQKKIVETFYILNE